EIKKLNRTEQYVPVTFRNYHIKDVTEEYMTPVDVCLKLKRKTNSQYAYLAVFNNKEWIPVQFGKIKNSKVTFQKMGKGIVYLPAVYGEKGLIPAANPFILNSRGEYQELIPDMQNKQTLILDRKYPVLPGVYKVAKKMLNGKIQASNNPDFNKSVTIHTVKEMGTKYGEIRIDSINEKYQYWRYLSPDSAGCNIAELYFFPENALDPVYGKVIGTSGSRDNKKEFVKEVTFDNNPLTYNYAPKDSVGWVGMDFGKPVSISRIIYIPRSDGNGVLFGNEYELFYWDKDAWQSLGRKTTSGVRLIYENCPSDALFLLHNHTEGKEERIFTYENGEQKWW
ncbi:MAG: discoidin domain-containing protein, partial [Bacteroidales bacterium]|nr:discoidin domain-containing protein [Bacteroidales bacterium]